MLKRFKKDSLVVDDPRTVKAFLSNPDFPFLVSFPRTGSHWLRMLMELYFMKPALVRAFYFQDAVDFTCYHTHDMNLDVERRNVIYLYRDPVHTIYSQLRYYRENVDDIDRIKYWSMLYGNHLSKWLVRENITQKKTIITYEGLKLDVYEEFGKVCRHFGIALDADRLATLVKRISKDELKKVTRHDQQVVDLSATYEIDRQKFEQKHDRLVRDLVIECDHHLGTLFT